MNPNNLNQLSQKLDQLKKKMNLLQKQQELAGLLQQQQQSNFWDNPRLAQQASSQISQLEKDLAQIKSLDQQLLDCQEFDQLLLNQPDKTLQQELDASIQKIEKDLSFLEDQTYLSGPYDDSFAILSVHSGQGGTEAMDWASMLQRMYTRFFEKKQWQFSLLDLQLGEEAGIKSASFEIKEPRAYGFLRRESGVHRLVRLSPFNADNLRQTSFAKVEVSPILKDPSQVEIKPEDIDFAAFRAGGHGGQNVNKVSTAVRLTHRPSGLTVSCQSQRSQQQNRDLATEMLISKLWALKQEKAEQEKSNIKGKNINASWGQQIRSYVLHPYKMVKDLRTRHETSQADAVLDGDLEPFIQAEIRL